jgi:hypothetical protein
MKLETPGKADVNRSQPEMVHRDGRCCNVELMGATPTIYARSRDRWRAYTSNTSICTENLDAIKRGQVICDDSMRGRV